jgi:hypothetical protein
MTSTPDNVNWSLLGPLLVTATVAVGGWFIGHALSARRDKNNKKREQRIVYLIEAYRRLATCAHRGNSLDVATLETAVTDIQLFGSKRQVALVQSFVSSFAKSGGASMDELLEDLRSDLRAELKLEKVPNGTMHVRFVPDKKPEK